MPDYLYPAGSSDAECRDLLREIDAGELDEHYLIKNADDYGRRASSRPLTAFAKLLNLAMRSSQPTHIGKPVKTVSRPATQ